jgi:hypothetical protein
VLPLLLTAPLPVKVTPAQQKRYSPVRELSNIEVCGLASSCKQTSKTVTVKEQLAVLPAASRAVQVTVVVPTANDDPEGGLQTVVAAEQLSVVFGAGKLTTVPALPGAVTAVTPAGQLIVGACVSTTVTLNEQATPAAGSHVTVVAPIGKTDPGGGKQATGPQAGPEGAV